MKIGFLFLLILFYPVLALSSEKEENSSVDYCYKPDKPLLFAKRYHKQRYEEAVQEYQNCVRQFSQFQENLATMQSESEKNAQEIRNKFYQEH